MNTTSVVPAALFLATTLLIIRYERSKGLNNHVKGAGGNIPGRLDLFASTPKVTYYTMGHASVYEGGWIYPHPFSYILVEPISSSTADENGHQIEE
jgi:hypothetical protein